MEKSSDRIDKIFYKIDKNYLAIKIMVSSLVSLVPNLVHPV